MHSLTGKRQDLPQAHFAASRLPWHWREWQGQIDAFHCQDGQKGNEQYGKQQFDDQAAAMSQVADGDIHAQMRPGAQGSGRPDETKPDEEQLCEIHRPDQRVAECPHDCGDKHQKDDQPQQDDAANQLETFEYVVHGRHFSASTRKTRACPFQQTRGNCRPIVLRLRAMCRADRHNPANRRPVLLLP